MKTFQYDKIVMIHADCMDYLKDVPAEYFQLSIVDPPYGIGEDGASNHSRNQLAQAIKYSPKEWDKAIPGPEYFAELRRVSKHQIIWGGNYFTPHLPSSMGWIFWDKNASGDFSDGELAYTSFNRALKKFTFTWNGMRQGDAWAKETRVHPCQKPRALYAYLLENYAEHGWKILDTHGGSGSICLAAADLGFSLTWIEKDEEYFDAAVARLREHLLHLTSKEKKLIEKNKGLTPGFGFM